MGEVVEGLPNIPQGMPLTNRLDQMTREQAIFAIQNGDTWLAFLKQKSESVIL